MKNLMAVLAFLVVVQTAWTQEAKPPVRIAVVGLVHDHAFGFIPMFKNRPEAELVGIVEPDHDLRATYAKRFNLSSNLFYSTIDELFAATNVDALAAFTATFDHRKVVEAAASHHVTVMMEKPMAVNMDEAKGIETAARQGGIQIIVNYETTWYPSTQMAFKMADEENAVGPLRKIVVHDGHRGPREIGCSETFLKWLTDPKLNGGGALPDFGCYGAGLVTWLMDEKPPTSVFAVTQHIKPEIYPKVEDEATIVLTYPAAQAIIQASWNWPIDRKDMEVYGKTGYILAPRKDQLRFRQFGHEETQPNLPAQETAGASRDQLAYLAAVIRGEIKPSGPSSLENNMIVTEILDAARQSAETGRRIDLGPTP